MTVSTTPDIGDAPIIFVDCANVDGDAETPTDGRLLVAPPGATESTVIPWASLDVEPGSIVGRVQWQVSPAFDVAGTWEFRWEFTAGLVAAEAQSIVVNPSNVPDPAA